MPEAPRGNRIYSKSDIITKKGWYRLTKMNNPIMRKSLRAAEGFTLAELLLAVIILGFVLGGLLQVFIRCSVLAELAYNKTVAMSEAQGKMEEIRSYDYGSIAADYASGGSQGNTFSLSQLTGTGVIYIDSSNADLLEVEIVVSWQNKYGRIIGEDIDLDGALDSGEDVDGNNKLSSIATLVSLIAAR